MRDFIPGLEVPLRVVLVTPVLLFAFIGIIFWVYRRSARTRYEKIAQLPLEEIQERPDVSKKTPPRRTGNGE